MKIDVSALGSWIELNDYLRSADEEQCQSLIKIELKGSNRPTFLRRIHSRMNKVRADRERKELVK